MTQLLSDEELLAGDWPGLPTTAAGTIARSTARLIESAVPFWLPPGQTSAYLESDPIGELDRDLLRLPYRRVLVVPSEPLHVASVDGEDFEERRLIEDEAVRNSRRIRLEGGSSVQAPVSIPGALDCWGGWIEAVLLESDAAGRRSDRVVWCIAIPSKDGSAVLSRVTVPAFASRSIWSAEPEQFAAAIAWGDWVEHPIDEATARTAPHDSAGEPHPGDVRVLSVRRRSQEAEPGRAQPTGRTLAPHRRKGHWGRQHFGPGGRDVKMVRIAPVLVNSALGPLVPQVYRLPMPQPSEVPSPD